jgi:cytochrome c553
LLEKIRNGVPNTPMPAWKRKLSEEDILKMGAYIHVLRGTAIDNPLPGDAARGEEVFFGTGECSSCHSMKGKGGLIAPDLTEIAGRRKAINIRNALTKQEHRLWMDGGEHLASLPPMDTYDPVRVILRDGHKIDGVLLNQDSYSLQVMGLNNQLHLLDRARVSTIAKKPPLMPTDYDKRLTEAEFRDLMAFLTRQGQTASPSSAEAQSPASPD